MAQSGSSGSFTLVLDDGPGNTRGVRPLMIDCQFVYTSPYNRMEEGYFWGMLCGSVQGGQRERGRALGVGMERDGLSLCVRTERHVGMRVGSRRRQVRQREDRAMIFGVARSQEGRGISRRTTTWLLTRYTGARRWARSGHSRRSERVFSGRWGQISRPRSLGSLARSVQRGPPARRRIGRGRRQSGPERGRLVPPLSPAGRACRSQTWMREWVV